MLSRQSLAAMWFHLAVAFSLSVLSLGSGGLIPKLLPQRIGLAATMPQANPVATTKGISTTPRFTVTYPDHWIEYSNNQTDYVIIYNQRIPAIHGGTAPPYLIKTDLFIQNADLRDILQADQEEPSPTRRAEVVTVNGRPGVRVWEATPGLDFPHLLATYLPMGNGEVFTIVSYYSCQNQYAEAAILRLHDSVQLR